MTDKGKSGTVLDTTSQLAATKTDVSLVIVLRNLVEACEGEVEEVFGGEPGEALQAARNALGCLQHQQ